mmetsp:Transcript_11656/g.34999  ORF Transcript_11656/g.34999 Transcript_11656/m.34999 type:complete len:235 (-) Transcript_11656:283-987(-)
MPGVEAPGAGCRSLRGRRGIMSESQTRKCSDSSWMAAAAPSLRNCWRYQPVMSRPRKRCAPSAEKRRANPSATVPFVTPGRNASWRWQAMFSPQDRNAVHWRAVAVTTCRVRGRTYRCRAATAARFTQVGFNATITTSISGVLFPAGPARFAQRQSRVPSTKAMSPSNRSKIDARHHARFGTDCKWLTPFFRRGAAACNLDARDLAVEGGEAAALGDANRDARIACLASELPGP